MAAVSEARRGGLGCVGWLIILAVLGCILLGSIEIPDVGTVEIGNHATDRHGSEAELVRSELAAGGGRHHKCKDGKEYITKRLDDGRYALMVLRNGYEVTSFIADYNYVDGKLRYDGCGGRP